MGTYDYTVKRKRGKTVKGTMSTSSEEAVKQILEAKYPNYTMISIGPAAPEHMPWRPSRDATDIRLG